MATPSSSRPTSGSPVQATATGSRLRADAEVLAAVYQLLRAREAVPLDRSAEPPKVVPHGALNVKSPLLTAITDVVKGDDSHAKRRIYSAAYWAVIPKVSETAAQVAASALDKQFRELVKLEQRIRQPNVAQRLHDIAVNVVRRLDGLSVTNKDYENARVTLGRDARTEPAESHPDWQPQWRKDRDKRNDPQFNAVEDASLRSRLGAALAAELPRITQAKDWVNPRSEIAKLCRVLYEHPDSVELMRRYAESGSNGDSYARHLVIDALAATLAFSRTLTAPEGDQEHVWRYPPLITAGIKRLALNRVPAFPDYMADLGQVLATSRLDQTLFVMGWVLFVVSLSASFPLTAAAAVGVAGASGALAGLALADFALAVPQAAMTYLDEREQDWAAVSGSFHPAARIAVRSPFGRTGLAAAAALLAGLAFVSSGTRFLKAVRAAKPPTPPASAIAARRGAKSAQGIPPRGTGYRARLSERTRGIPAEPRWDQRPLPAREPMRRVAGLPEELQPAVSAYQRPWLRRQSASARDVAPVASAGGSSKGGDVSTTPLISGSQAASVGSKAIGAGPGSNSLGSPKVGSKATTSSGTGPARLPARLNTVPELPIPRESLDRSTPGKFLKFFRENRSAYPSEIRDLIDKVPLRNPPEAKLRAIDKAIRDLHTAEANRLAGFANAAEKPFINSQRAVSNEGGELASLLTDEKVLSLKGQIPGGGTAEFDSVEFVGSRIIEEKQSLNWITRTGETVWKSPDEIFRQMKNQAEFVTSWKRWSQVEWRVRDYESWLLAKGVHGRLEELHPDLASRIVIPPM